MAETIIKMEPSRCLINTPWTTFTMFQRRQWISDSVVQREQSSLNLHGRLRPFLQFHGTQRSSVAHRPTKSNGCSRGTTPRTNRQRSISLNGYKIPNEGSAARQNRYRWATDLRTRRKRSNTSPKQTHSAVSVPSAENASKACGASKSTREESLTRHGSAWTAGKLMACEPRSSDTEQHTETVCTVAFIARETGSTKCSKEKTT